MSSYQRFVPSKRLVLFRRSLFVERRLWTGLVLVLGSLLVFSALLGEWNTLEVKSASQALRLTASAVKSASQALHLSASEVKTASQALQLPDSEVTTASQAPPLPASEVKTTSQALQLPASEVKTASGALQLPASFENVHKLSEPLEYSPNTMVTAYFTVPSKHTGDEYKTWMQNMLSIQDNLVVFTSHDLADTIRSFRAHAPQRTVVVELELGDLPIASIYNEKFWPHQLEIDPEKRIHQSFELFWIWLSKSWFVDQAIQANYFQSDFYAWCDIGYFRTDRFNSQVIIQQPEIVPEGSVLWLAHNSINPPPVVLWNEKLRQSQHFFHTGGFGAGSSAPWRAFHKHFAETLDLFVDQGMFVGEDQCVLQSTCLRVPSLCAYVPHEQVKDANYFALRTVLQKRGVQYELWRPGSS